MTAKPAPSVGLPTVDVVITSYNQKAYLVEAIESVLAQTRPCERIIISDDCSNDGSQELLRDYERRFPEQITAICQPHNLGIPRNRTAALQQVTADYVAILDGDDRYLPGNLEAQLATLVQHPGAGSVFSNIYFIDASGRRTAVRDATRPPAQLLYSLARGRMGIERSMLMRTELVREAGYLDQRFPYHDGFLLTLELAIKADIAYVLEPQAEYRVHDRGVSKAITVAERLVVIEAIAAEVERITFAHLSSRERRQIAAAWRQRKDRYRLELATGSGQPVRRLWRLARAFVRSPNHRRALGRWIGGSDA